METFDYTTKKEKYLKAQNPFKVIRKNEIQYLGENIYELDGREFEVSPLVVSQIDKFIGLNKKQIKAVHLSSGDDGVRDYRNYIAMVNSIADPQNLAIIANPEKRTIIGATPLREDAIPMESFFDFAEMFANDNHYSIGGFSKGSDVTTGLELKMIPHDKHIESFGKDEEFMTNGFIMKWNLGEIEIGHYYERLVCSNGAVQKVYKKQSSFYSLEDKNIRTLLSYPQYESSDFNNFKQNAITAIESKASLSELQQASKILLSNGVGNDLVEQIIPFNRDLQEYKKKGYNKINCSTAKSSQTFWDVFNRLTFFASHNDIWESDDNRRSQVLVASVALLHRQRDIKEYLDVF